VSKYGVSSVTLFLEVSCCGHSQTEQRSRLYFCCYAVGSHSESCSYLACSQLIGSLTACFRPQVASSQRQAESFVLLGNVSIRENGRILFLDKYEYFIITLSFSYKVSQNLKLYGNYINHQLGRLETLHSAHTLCL
jgi:hypothetical protein